MGCRCDRLAAEPMKGRYLQPGAAGTAGAWHRNPPTGNFHRAQLAAETCLPGLGGQGGQESGRRVSGKAELGRPSPVLGPASSTVGLIAAAPRDHLPPPRLQTMLRLRVSMHPWGAVSPGVDHPRRPPRSRLVRVICSDRPRSRSRPSARHPPGVGSPLAGPDAPSAPHQRDSSKRTGHEFLNRGFP